MSYDDWHGCTDWVRLIDDAVAPYDGMAAVGGYIDRKLQLVALACASRRVSHDEQWHEVRSLVLHGQGLLYRGGLFNRPMLQSLVSLCPEDAARELLAYVPDPCEVVRDIIPHPADVAGFRDDYRTPDAVRLALAAQDDTSVRPILADALDDAGYRGFAFCRQCRGRGGVALQGGVFAACPACEGQGVITAFPITEHLRSGGTHYHGCWAVEVILGH